MDIREYSYILAVVECGTISKAAEKLYISQPSLSTYIKNLENRLGFSFFEKNSTKGLLTPEGSLYVEYARQIVTLNNNLYLQLDHMKERKTRMVRMGIPHTRAYVVLPKILPVAEQLCPQILLQVKEGTSIELENALQLNELDFAILNYPFKVEKLEYQVLKEEEMVLVVPEKNPICQFGVSRPDCAYPWMDLKYLDGQPLIVQQRGQRLRQISDHLMEEADVHPRIIYETKNSLLINKLSQMGWGVSFIFDPVLEDPFFQTGIHAFSVGNPKTLRKLVFAYPEGGKLSGAAREMMEVVKKQIL